MLRVISIVCMIMTCAAPALSQATREHVLDGRGISPSQGSPRRVTSVEGSDDARAIVKVITSAVGFPATQFDVRAAEGIANAEATTENDGRDRLILYNPDWMKTLKASIGSDWSYWLVLAHEVGHHLAFHMDPAFPNHEAELQADYFAGFILNKLGAPLTDVQLAMAMVSTDAATVTHPGKAQRVEEVRKGWDAAARNVGANVIPAVLSAPPPGTGPGSATGNVAEQRYALLIGNTNYQKMSRLKNPKNDVIAVGRQLRLLGFATTVLYDGTSDQIATAMAAFKDEAKDADWALVYFAGSGIEVNGINYMLPIEADDRRAKLIPTDFPLMRIDTAFAAVKGAKHVRLVVVDACRIDPSNLPDASNRVASVDSLKVVEPPRGVVVAYSTAAGQYALDGTDDISPYAQSMVRSLKIPGIEISKVFRNVSAEVEAGTKGVQLPTVIGNWPADEQYVSRK